MGTEFEENVAKLEALLQRTDRLEDLGEAGRRELWRIMMQTKGLVINVPSTNASGEVYEFKLTNLDPNTGYWQVEFADGPDDPEAFQRMRSYRVEPVEKSGVEWGTPTIDDFQLVFLNETALQTASEAMKADYQRVVAPEALDNLSRFLPFYAVPIVGKLFWFEDLVAMLEYLHLAKSALSALSGGGESVCGSAAEPRNRKGRQRKGNKRKAPPRKAAA